MEPTLDLGGTIIRPLVVRDSAPIEDLASTSDQR